MKERSNMHWFSLLFFSLFNVYELKYFVKYWKTGKPLRTTACVADAIQIIQIRGVLLGILGGGISDQKM